MKKLIITNEKGLVAEIDEFSLSVEVLKLKDDEFSKFKEGPRSWHISISVKENYDDDRASILSKILSDIPAEEELTIEINSSNCQFPHTGSCYISETEVEGTYKLTGSGELKEKK